MGREIKALKDRLIRISDANRRYRKTIEELGNFFDKTVQI
jgi:hypothetical protein